MDKKTAKVLGALFTALASERYTHRTVKKIAQKCGASQADVCDVVYKHDEYFITSTRQSDNAVIVRLADE